MELLLGIAGEEALGAKDEVDEEKKIVAPLRKLLPEVEPKLKVGVSDGTLDVLAADVGPNPNPPLIVG